MTKVNGTPVAGRSTLLQPRLYSKWSRRGRRMRLILLAVCRVVGMLASVLRVLRWLFELL